MAPAKPPKVKSLTSRRRRILVCFLKKTQMYPELYGEIGEKGWKDMFIDFLCEPKARRANERDIDAWLKLPIVMKEISEQAKWIAENPRLPSPPTADYEMSRSSSDSWPWSSFQAAIGLTRLSIRQTEKKKESTPNLGYVAHSSGRKLKKKRVDTRKKVIKAPEIARPVDQRNCNIM